MARIELPLVDTMSETDRALYDRFPTNLIRAVLRTSNCTAGYMALGFALLRNTDLTPKQFELVILRVAALSASAYERMQHLAPARLAGWSDAEIDAIETGRKEKLDTVSAALLTFVDECVRQVRVCDQTFAQLHTHMPENAIADVTLLVGYYMMTARILETLDVELDEAPCAVLADRDSIEMIAAGP
ncbi:carboxymuconolactone decarboxylase family protein [Ochrobactrum sp. CM-21-5]|nr:carboxymuconolactone decarboxylase family protein [Ochrobactrum sp. CM-21-5]MBC2884544.1 carboxymuconolactone decarboxylase family protein [Ochrobactrum sp. CM-21-5]